LDFSFEIVVFLKGRNCCSKSTCDLEERISWLDNILDDSIIVIIHIDTDSIHIDIIGDAVISLGEARSYSQLIVCFATKFISIHDHKDEEYDQE